MANYYNNGAPPPWGNYAQPQPPPFPPQQQYSPPQPQAQYSPPAQYNQQYSPVDYAQQPSPQFSPTGMEPTTPLLDANQMNYFFHEVNRGNIPTIPSAQPQGQPFTAPPFPPQMPPGFAQQQAPPQQQANYNAPPPLPPQVQQQSTYQPDAYQQYYGYSPPQQIERPQELERNDVQMQDMAGNHDAEDSWGEDDEDDYAPPEVTVPAPTNGITQTSPYVGGAASIAAGKQPQGQESPKTQGFNPFKSQSLHQAPLPVPQAQAPSMPPVPPQQLKLNLELRHKAGDVLKDFYEHSIGYDVLAAELDAADKELLKELYTIYGVPQQAPPVQPPMPAPAVSQPKEIGIGEKIEYLRKQFASSGVDLDDATLATIMNSEIGKNMLAAMPKPQTTSTLPGLGTPQQAQDANRPTPPNRSLSTGTPAAAADARSAYLAKLAGAKSKLPTSQQATPAAKPASALPGLGAASTPGVSTPQRKVQLNQANLKEKMARLRAEQAAKAQQATATVTASRPQLLERTDSMSSIQYESGQASGQSSDETANNADADASSLEEGEELEEGEMEEDGDEDGEVLESGEIVDEQSKPALAPSQPPPSIPGLSAKPPMHSRNVSNNSAPGTPQNANQPARSSGPPLAHLPPPDLPDFSRYRKENKRTANTAFGNNGWGAYPAPKRTYPPAPGAQQPEHEPVVIDISSEGEWSDDEDEGGMGFGNEGIQAIASPAIKLTSAVPSSTNTPDPIAQDTLKQLAIQKAAAEKLKRAIDLREAKERLMKGTSSPLAPSPAVAAIRASSVASAARSRSQAASSPAAASRRAQLQAYEEAKKEDQDKLAAILAQAEQLKQEMARKEAEMKAMSDEIEAFGVDTAGMTHEEMVEVRDGLVEEQAANDAAAEALQEEARAAVEEAKLEADEGETDSSEEDSEDEGEIEEDEEGEIEDDGAMEIDRPGTGQIGEAGDHRALASGSHVHIKHVPLSVTRQDIIQMLGQYDITGITMQTQRQRGKKRRDPTSLVMVDFLYPAEAEQAIAEFDGQKLGNRNIALSLVGPNGPQTTFKALGDRAMKGRASQQPQPTSKDAPFAFPKETYRDSQRLDLGSDPEYWAANYCILRVGGLAQRLCTPSSMEGWLGKYKARAHNLTLQKANDGSPTGVMDFEVADEASAREIVHFIEAKRKTKNSRGISVRVVESPTTRRELAAVEADRQAQRANVSKAPTALLEPEIPAEEEESSGSESDDEAESEDEDAMSESEDESSEEGEVDEDDEEEFEPAPASIPGSVTDPTTLDATVENRDSDSMSESESGSGSDSDSGSDEDEAEDATGNVGVSLQDVEGVPMDDDGISDDDASSSGESANSDAMEPSDDEEGEVEEVVQAALPEGGSDSDESDSEEGESGEVHGSVASIQNSVDFAPAPTTDDGIVEPHQDAPGDNDDMVNDATTDFVPAPIDAAAPVVPQDHAPALQAALELPGNLPMPVVDDAPALVIVPQAQTQTQSVAIDTAADVEDTEMVDDENDDDFYDPSDAVPAVAEIAQEEQDAEGSDDDYDPDFDAAFEDAFAEIEKEEQQAAKATQPSSATLQNEEMGNAAEKEKEPMPTTGQFDGSAEGMNGIPDVSVSTTIEPEKGADSAMASVHDGENNIEADDELEADNGTADMEMSEDGEVLSDDEYNPSYLEDAIPKHNTVATGAHHHRRAANSPPIDYDVPSVRPLGMTETAKLASIPSNSYTPPAVLTTAPTTASTSTFKPFTSALKGFKSYRFHENYDKEVAGGIKSSTYTHKIDANQPMCPAEMDGKDCQDRANCGGQHWDDWGVVDGE